MFSLFKVLLATIDPSLSTENSPSFEAMHELSPGDLGAAFVKMLLTLLALIALLVGSLWLLRRLLQQRLQKGTGNQAIQVLEKKMISPKTMLYLVEVEGKKVLLAESHLEVRKLQDFKEEESPISKKPVSSL